MRTGANSKTKNGGFSLIELLVVIAVLAIISVGAISGISMISGWKIKECTEKLSSAIGETQMNAMSKEACSLLISMDGNGNYYMEMTGMQPEEIADGAFSITYVSSENPGEQSIPEGGLKLSFDRSSGACQPIDRTPEGDYIYCRKIIIRRGSRTKTIRLVKDTGRHYIE